MTAQPKTVWVLDDHFLIAEAIGKILAEEAGYRFTGGYTQSASLLEAIREQGTPDYLLLDINLNGEDGIALCKQLKKSWPALHIIMLTGLNQPAIIKNSLKNGASGFLLKNMQHAELIECLKQVGNGETYLHAPIEKILLQSSLPGKSGSTDFLPKLSRREKEVLDLIVKEYTTQEIAEALFLSVNTVETHRASLLTKLGARNIAGLVRITLEKGLLDK